MSDLPEKSLSENLEETRRTLQEQLESVRQQAENLRRQIEQFSGSAAEHLGRLGEQAASLEEPVPSAGPGLDKILAGVRNLVTATNPAEVFQVLVSETAAFRLKSVVFEIRGKSVWGAAADGFGEGLTQKALKGLVVPLSKPNPFRQVYETGGSLSAPGGEFKRCRSVVDKLAPTSEGPILLLPIRTGGSVSAILYLDSEGRDVVDEIDGLKLLTEFSSAQLDRLMFIGEAPGEGAEVEEVLEEVVEEVEASEDVLVEEVPAEEEEEVSLAEREAEEAPAEAVEAPGPAEAGPPDLSQLNEEEQNVHRDAKRFAKLLISEIELYSKVKVSEGRKNKDLYGSLKTDLQRSRQTYEKRFAKTQASRHDYLHDEIVRILANDDASILGPDYPGPSN